MRNFCNIPFSPVPGPKEAPNKPESLLFHLTVRLPNMFPKNIDSGTILSGFNLVLILLDFRLINHLGLSFLICKMDMLLACT